ncbi:MAG: hypothetical protein K0S76_2254 [Herbinix sp.]|jgi:CheY-like chemotaxis protein|nr:hypothetical protein [Herbinix sp.]
MDKVEDFKLKALVVDDNEVNTVILANMLELFGIQADQVFSGKEAVNLFKKNYYDLVFVDHVMPNMDGLETTDKLNRCKKEKNKTAFFALTAHVTDEMKVIYSEKGADGVFSKPLALTDLVDVLNKLFPHLSFDEIIHKQEKPYLGMDKEEIIKSLLEEIPEIDYIAGLKYAIGNSIQFVHILKVSLRDMKSCRSYIKEGLNKENLDDVIMGVHNLKSVLINIGAVGLFETTKVIYQLLRDGQYDQIIEDLIHLVCQINDFSFRLEKVLNHYEAINYAKTNVMNTQLCRVTELEYVQCLTNTLYYIKSYEYDAIIKELQYLIRAGQPEDKSEFMKALEEVKEFDYDSAMNRINKIKEKIGF